MILHKIQPNNMIKKILSRVLLASAITLGGGALVMTTAVPTEAAKKKSKKKSSSSKRYDKYTGTVGKYRVTMYINMDNSGNVSGYYYYGNGSRGKLQLRGYTGDPCGAACVTIYMTEYSGGKETGTWEVYLSGMSVSPGVRAWGMTGEMTTGGRTYEVSLWQ